MTAGFWVGHNGFVILVCPAALDLALISLVISMDTYSEDWTHQSHDIVHTC
jgi:hypothetical protein